MKINCDWNGKQNFVANVNGFKIHMDATKPYGDAGAPTPKQLVLASLCGCTGMDVIGLLKKNQQNVEKFSIEAEASVADTHPHALKDIKIRYFINGLCEPNEVKEAIHLSQTKYCAVSSMISQSTPITYDISLNGKILSWGSADFQRTAFTPTTIGPVA